MKYDLATDLSSENTAEIIRWFHAWWRWPIVMKAQQILGLAWTNMSRRKLRTSLTTLGIVIGVMALISIQAMGSGFRSEVTQRMVLGLDPDIISILPASDLFTAYGFDYLTLDESEKISAFDGVEAVLPLQRKGVVLHKPDDHMETRLLGVNFTLFIQIYGHRLSFASGGVPDPVTNDSVILGYMGHQWAGVGETVKAEITVRVGNGIEFRNHTFSVKGLLNEIGYSGTIPFDRSVIIPLDTCREIHETDHLEQIIVKVTDPALTEDVAQEIRRFYDYNVLVLVSSTVVETVQGIFNIVELFLLGIAFIALLVAGISILNIMLVTVMERTREIGIMKALGATNRTIMGQFLTEAVLLGFIGSLLGLVLGWVLALGLGQVIPSILSTNYILAFIPTDIVLTPVLTIDAVLLSVLFAIIVSIVFALYPARKAAQLDPVQALRYE